MLQLAQINVYPVKSLDGYSPLEAIVEKRGLLYDRRWMITDPHGKFMSQRTHGRMALLRAYIEDQQLVIQEKRVQGNSISIPLHLVGSEAVQVTVWEDRMSALKMPGAVSEWLSDFLGTSCQLVVMPDTTERRVDEKYNRGADLVSFADGYPFLLLGEASMADLNERIFAKPKEPVPTADSVAPLSIRRFRANFIFTGGFPYQEDSFSSFYIGVVAFQGVKPCARCVLVTRDPDSGISGKEPLATLSSYRQKDNKVIFGRNIVWKAEQWKEASAPMVKVGDQIHF